MTYKLAIAGLYFHANYLLNMPDNRVKITALADKRHAKDSIFFNPERDPEEIAKQKGVKLYANPAEMIDQENPDIVGVCWIDSQKKDIIVEALKRNKHVISDKPLCTTMEQFKAIEAAFEKSKGSLAMLLPLTYLPIIKKLKELVDKGKLGEILAVRSRRAYIQKVTRRPKWFFTKEYGGGILCDVGTHDLDLVRFLIGKDAVETAGYAGNGKLREFATGEDYSQAIFKMGNNILYSLQVDRIAPSKTKGEQSAMEIYGTKGQAIIPAGYNQLIVTTEGKDSPEIMENFPAPDHMQIINEYLDCLDRKDYSKQFFAPAIFNSVRGVLGAQASADAGGMRMVI